MHNTSAWNETLNKIDFEGVTVSVTQVPSGKKRIQGRVKFNRFDRLGLAAILQYRNGEYRQVSLALNSASLNAHSQVGVYDSTTETLTMDELPGEIRSLISNTGRRLRLATSK